MSHTTLSQKKSRLKIFQKTRGEQFYPILCKKEIKSLYTMLVFMHLLYDHRRNTQIGHHNL